MTRGTPRPGPRFATRLLLAQTLVLLAGALTIWLVASTVGPSIFHDHLQQAGLGHTQAEADHVEEAFAYALVVSLSVALVAALVAALAVSWYFSRRIQRSVGHVADASSRIAAGRYDTHVEDPGLGTEFATLAGSYNSLADRLGATEATRRRMLADLAHEMRTPLASIDAHLEAVEDGVRDLDTDTIAVLRSSTGRLRRLAEDIGAVSQAEEGNLRLDARSVNAATLTASAADPARDRYQRKGVRLETDLRPAGRVDVDPDRLGQALGNLLDNALRHTPAGGKVTVTCRRVEHWVECAVADSGDGIAAEHLPHIFDRFFRVDTARDREHGGSGIGLAIAKAIIEAHGGGIFATSPGAGHGAGLLHG
ncbi:MAG TPA: ATP-binding protein [Acidimicrobiales bacterium]